MKANLQATLLLMPLAALSMPVVLIERLPPKIQTTPTPIETIHPKYSVTDAPSNGDYAAAPVPFVNSPITPSISSTPDVILSLPRPLTTSYLKALSSSPKDSIPLNTEAQEAVELWATVQVEPALVGRYPDGHPKLLKCHRSRRAMDHNSNLVVFLALAFLTIVVVVEAWGSVSAKVRQSWAGQGVVRPEEAENAGRQPLSVQAETKDMDAVQAV